ncbi:MAG TPA: hypothetical protein VFU89_05465 [Rhabdochlamydiaceae bacterium]|nr:hypothetical protein [Rhabdochlamydiaceae bacterium]
MTNKVGNREYNRLEKDVEGLNQLKGFRDQWRSSDKTIRGIWTSFRLLPLKVAYLIASHYHYVQFDWSATKLDWSTLTKWKLYARFDKKLLKNEDPERISSSIDSAVWTQRKIVGLQKVVATLEDKSKTLQDKTHAYKDLETNEPTIYRSVLHKILIAKKTPIRSPSLAEAEINQQPDGCSGDVVKEMLSLYRRGHPRAEDRFFKRLSKCH